jgi:hypothetical protein
VTDPSFDLSQAHRWFAVELNNRAWDLVETAELSADDINEMIGAAHAAKIHWQVIGNRLNLLRAEYLLATAYAKAQLAQSAVYHAEKAIGYSDQVGDKQTAFDRASAHGCAAAAYACAGDSANARFQREILRELTAALTKSSEQELLHKLYGGPRNG